MISVLDIVEDTMVDGPGFRTSIYCAGCRHACPGCHNPQSWDFSGGHPMSTEQIMRIIEADPYANVTFSGVTRCTSRRGLPNLPVPSGNVLIRISGALQGLPTRRCFITPGNGNYWN